MIAYSCPEHGRIWIDEHAGANDRPDPSRLVTARPDVTGPPKSSDRPVCPLCGVNLRVEAWTVVVELSIDELNDRLHQFPSCSTGGPLHIVTDDGNVEDHNLQFCREEVEGDHWSLDEVTPEEAAEIRRICNELLDELEKLTESQRLDALGYPSNHLND